MCAKPNRQLDYPLTEVVAVAWRGRAAVRAYGSVRSFSCKVVGLPRSAHRKAAPSFRGSSRRCNPSQADSSGFPAQIPTNRRHSSKTVSSASAGHSKGWRIRCGQWRSQPPASATAAASQLGQRQATTNRQQGLARRNQPRVQQGAGANSKPRAAADSRSRRRACRRGPWTLPARSEQTRRRTTKGR